MHSDSPDPLEIVTRHQHKDYKVGTTNDYNQSRVDDLDDVVDHVQESENDLVHLIDIFREAIKDAAMRVHFIELQLRVEHLPDELIMQTLVNPHEVLIGYVLTHEGRNDRGQHYQYQDDIVALLVQVVILISGAKFAGQSIG